MGLEISNFRWFFGSEKLFFTIKLLLKLYRQKIKICANLLAFRLTTLLRDSNTGVFLCILQIFIYFEKHLRTAASDYVFTIMKKTMMKKMFIEIRLCNPVTYNFKGHVKFVEIYMVKFNVSVLNRLKIMGFFVNAKYIRKYNVIWNKCQVYT